MTADDWTAGVVDGDEEKAGVDDGDEGKAAGVVDGRAEIDDIDAFLGRLDEIGTETGCTLQAFDARYVVDEAHLQRALARADRARERGTNVARERGVETLLYAAGRRQIDDALQMGVSEGRCPTVVLVAANGASDGNTSAGNDDASAGNDDTSAGNDDTSAGNDASAESDASAADERRKDARDRQQRAADQVRALSAFDSTATVLGAFDAARLRSFFDVTDRELRATDGDLTDVVHERVALLDVEK